MAEADVNVTKTEQQYRRGLITDEERKTLVIEIWNKANDAVTKALMESLDKFNPVYMMANSGARGNVQQLRQLAGMRGLMADPSGRKLNFPLKQTSVKAHSSGVVFIISSHGARKGLADTALRTADFVIHTAGWSMYSGFIVREDDCFVDHVSL